MKPAICVIALAVCQARYLHRGSQIRYAPSENARLVTDTFGGKLEDALHREWYFPDERRLKTSEVYQLSEEPNGNSTNLIADEGLGLYRGQMTQYRFSLIGENKNCIIGFTSVYYFRWERDFMLGLDLSRGAFIGKNVFKSIVEKEPGKDSDDVDWFIEYREGGDALVHVSLNGEPLNIMFVVPKSAILNGKLGGRIRPFLQCKGHMDSDEAIAVTQYSSIVIPSDRPYAASQRKRVHQTYYEHKNPGSILPKNINRTLLNKPFAKDVSVQLTIRDDAIEMHVLNTILCPVELRNNGLLGPKEKICWITTHEVEEPYSSLERYLAQFMMSSIRYKLLDSSGEFVVYSKKFEKLEFTPQFNR